MWWSDWDRSLIVADALPMAENNRLPDERQDLHRSVLRPGDRDGALLCPRIGVYLSFSA